MAYVDCGPMDLFFEMTLQPWDYAAGLIILSKAGGKTTDWDGEEDALGYLSFWYSMF